MAITLTGAVGGSPGVCAAGALRGGGPVLEPVVVRHRGTGLVRGQAPELVRLEAIGRYGELMRRRLVRSV